eukprot:Amastigsp_a179978_33.p2 type:complete len:232 gc:universal Amastigsp_a179978_33:145-840(+)
MKGDGEHCARVPGQLVERALCERVPDVHARVGRARADSLVVGRPRGANDRRLKVVRRARELCDTALRRGKGPHVEDENNAVHAVRDQMRARVRERQPRHRLRVLGQLVSDRAAADVVGGDDSVRVAIEDGACVGRERDRDDRRGAEHRGARGFGSEVPELDARVVGRRGERGRARLAHRNRVHDLCVLAEPSHPLAPLEVPQPAALVRRARGKLQPVADVANVKHGARVPS